MTSFQIDVRIELKTRVVKHCKNVFSKNNELVKIFVKAM